MKHYKPSIQFLLVIAIAVVLTFSAILLWQSITPLLASLFHQSVSTWMSNVNYLKGLQLVTSTTMFLLPPFVLVWILKQPVAKTLMIHRIASHQLWMLTLLSMLVIQPFINLLGDWNAHLALPAGLSWLEDWMKQMEAMNDALVNRFLFVHHWTGLLFNVVLIAFIPALAEEFFFRATVQRIFSEKLNTHVAVWLTAIIFSAVHMEFYGFLPRMLLGAYLGYLFVWSGTIWLPVIAHFTNNAVGVLIGYQIANHQGYDFLNQLGTHSYWSLSLIGMALFIPMAFLVYRETKPKSEHSVQ
ncbi:MAG: CPBP family intramembrane glutamic endopeptidase [Microbacter sp.]